MKNIFILLTMVFVLSGCLKEKDIVEIVDGLKEKKEKAEELVLANNFSTENLLVIQEYFFDFSEKVHLLKSEEKASERVAKMVKKSGIKQFCQDFFIPKSSWVKLNQYCDRGDYYACSEEVKEFSMIVEQFKNVLGANFESASNGVQECFN